jgi:hypothetical protein
MYTRTAAHTLARNLNLLLRYVLQAARYLPLQRVC